MEMLLVIVTMVSWLAAGVLAAAVWSLTRERREQTAARAEALRALAFSETTPMFGASVEPRAPMRRWAALAAVAVIMTSIAGTVFALHEDRLPSLGLAREHSIDLLALQQTTDVRGAFIVTGEVRNAPGGEPLKGLAARIELFDGSGGRVAAAATALPVELLQPGDASPFKVTVPNAAGVTRYRVQFQRMDGSLVPHVDRRASNASNDR
jgi:hypothetical protein